MRILAFADIHGSYEVVEEILQSETAFDAVVIGGDISTYGSPEEVQGAVAAFRAFGALVLAVTGNMDPPLLDHTISALGVSLNGRGVVLGDVGFCGVSASPVSILKTPNEIPEDEILRRAEAGWKEISDARWRLFVPHAPPHGTPLDRTFMGLHVGSTAVRKFVELRQPDAVICGHIHEARGITTLGKSTIINCGPAGKGCYGIVDIMETVHVELRPQRKGHDRTP